MKRDIIRHIDVVKAYCANHLGIKLEEYWLSQWDTDCLLEQLKNVPMFKSELLTGNTDLILDGVVIKTLGKHNRKCQHLTKSHFQDVGEIYCHDCRTIIGEPTPTATHRRSSNIGMSS